MLFAEQKHKYIRISKKILLFRITDEMNLLPLKAGWYLLYHIIIFRKEQLDPILAKPETFK